MSEKGIALNAPIALEPAVAQEEQAVPAEEALPQNVERIENENPHEKLNRLLGGFDIKRLVL